MTPSYWVQAPPAGPRPLWQRLGRWIIPAVVIVAAIAGALLNAGRDATGEISRAGTMHWSDLRVGDCFDFKDPTEDVVNDVTGRPCTEEHEYEVILIPTMREGSYPTEDEFNALVVDACIPAFDAYIGKDYQDSSFDIYSLIPSTDSWDESDRTVLCAVFHPRIHRLTESVKGSKR